MKSNNLNYRQLELLDNNWFADSWLEKLVSMVFQVGRGFINCFSLEAGISIEEACDLNGDVFIVRDRNTGDCRYFYSEDELRIWLDQWHYFG